MANTRHPACSSQVRVVQQLCAIQSCRGIEGQDELCGDADAPTDVARRRGVVPRHVGRDDGSEMLPCRVPTLRRYRQAVGRTGETRLGRQTALVGVRAWRSRCWRGACRCVTASSRATA
jgi:hypothetical protein